MAQTVKHLPTMQEIWVRSLGREDLLEKEMATPSSILAWKIPRTEEPGRLQSMRLQRVRHDWATSLYFHFEWSSGFPYFLQFKSKFGNNEFERVTGRKARGLQTEEIGCKCLTFFYISLKWQEETNYCYTFSPSLYKFKKRFLLKYCAAIMIIGSTWT